MTATFVRRYPGGLRGLGQTDSTDPFSGPAYSPSDITAVAVPVASSSSSDLAQIFTPLSKAGGAALQQYVSYQNPLYQKQTVALTPQGQVVYATNQPGGITSAGLTTGALAGGGMLLLVGGLVLVMIMAKK